ncbi:Werner syndrome ATP-dependent helicase homolog [Xenia sp. Carnegie-2017]|uniref:Werner syndrome ATP-dependent helicase homolog n=1 Tax=Xenia sp. Carnegie-2017 TaxID=2897299 RepID=UPI001F0420EE|nr:Werner syndrome ATP-dependent helicase homolog [Xenia sp. Carnegie-2017]
MARKVTRKLPPCFEKGMRESGLDEMKFPGKIYYCSHIDECNVICNELRNDVESVGFDIEWKVAFTSEVRKTALIQVCPSKKICYLFHLSMMNNFPSELKYILECENILKVGVGIHNDMQKLKKDFEINANGYLELSDFANSKLKSSEKWSLKGLVLNLVS